MPWWGWVLIAVGGLVVAFGILALWAWGVARAVGHK